MIIEKQKRKNRNESLFIFKFEDEQDFETFIKYIQSLFEYFDEPSYFEEIMNKLISRVDDKYATEEYKLSGCLFEDEFVYFTNVLLSLIFELNKLNNLLNDLNNSHNELHNISNKQIMELEKYEKLNRDTIEQYRNFLKKIGEIFSDNKKEKTKEQK